MKIVLSILGSLLLLAVSSPSLSLAVEPPQYLLTDEQEFISVGNALYREDPSRSISLDSLLDKERSDPTFWGPPRGINFGFSKSRYWVKFKIHRSQNSPVDWIMEQRYSIIQQIHVFFVKDGILLNQYRSGRIYPFSDRGILHRNPLFPILLTDTSPVECYVMLESQGTVQGAFKGRFASILKII
jgi:hypothetical protein